MIKDAVNKVVSKATNVTRVEGLVEGKTEVAQKTLQKGMNIELNYEISGLKANGLDALQRKVNGYDS